MYRYRRSKWWGRAAAVGALGFGVVGCAGDASEACDGVPSCAEPELAARGAVQARVRVLAKASINSFSVTPLAPHLLADESGVYWYEEDGAVFTQPRGESQVVQLRRGLEPSGSETRLRLVHGMAAGAERVYLGEAYLETNVIDHFPVPNFEPPGRLLSVPKQGGAATVLVELDDAVITPVATDGARLIVFVQRDSGGFYALDESSPELEPLPVRSQFFSARRLDDTLFWSDGEYPPSLLRSGFDDPAPELVMALESNDFGIGAGYLLARRGESLVLHDLGADRGRMLPSLGGAILSQTALDAEHAYWIVYDATNTTEAADVAAPQAALMRGSLVTGASTRLELPDVALQGLVSIVGQDSETLYVVSDDTLLAVEKP